MRHTPKGVYRPWCAPPTSHSPITVALVDDYDVVVLGVAHMLDPYRDRVLIAELDTNEPVADTVDIVMYDSFAQPESDHDEIAVLIDNPRARRVVVYTWNFHPDLVGSARRLGVHGYLSKTLAGPRSGSRPGSGARRRDRRQRPPTPATQHQRPGLARPR